MEHLDPKDPCEQRKFGFALGLGVWALGALRWLWHVRVDEAWPGAPWGFAAAGALLLTAAALAPGMLGPVLCLWVRFALLLNRAVSVVVLTVAYFGMLTPLRPVLHLLRGDPLRRERLPDAETYWEEPEEQPADIARYRQQF